MGFYGSRNERIQYVTQGFVDLGKGFSALQQ